jgi:copper chaperone CopZ
MKMKTKKTILTLFIALLTGSSAFANFVSAKVKVTGVTCSMCSNSVHKALSSLSFIDKIEVDLENAVFNVSFKPNVKVVIDEIKEKIEGAGFSVGQLVADFKFNNLNVSKDLHYDFEGNTYHFVNVQDKKLNDVVSIRFVDKGLTSGKEHKKYVGLTTYKCIKTGTSQDCCHMASKKRIYHVTI